MKCAFLYCVGTGFIINDINGISVDLSGVWRWKGSVMGSAPTQVGTVLGLNGRSALWDLKSPSGDPFPSLLDPNVWLTKTIDYPAAFVGGPGVLGTGFSMGAGINQGVSAVIAAIKALPEGMCFALGGYSQGAAVMSGVLLSGLQDGASGPLASYRDRFLGGVCFGNPRRQRDFLGEYGVWSGCWDDPGSNTNGGGAFPTTGPWRRLTGCDPAKWLEFTAPDDIFSSVGETDLGLGFNAALDAFLDLTRSNIVGSFFSGLVGDALAAVAVAMGDPMSMLFPWVRDELPESLRGPGSVGGRVNYYVDGTGMPFEFPGGGHTSYPTLPPADLDGTWTSSTTPVEPGDGKTYLQATKETCYQLGLRWLEQKAAERAVAPIILPSTPGTTADAGWGPTLLTPN